MIGTIDWATAASAATAAGTLVLAVATFSAVRSGQRAARATELALLAGIRPVLLASRFDDPEQKISFMDEHWVRVGGGKASAEATNDAVYLVVSLRNVGNGLAVLDRWDLYPHREEAPVVHQDPSHFRRLTRDLYVPAGDIGLWQGALRDPADPLFQAVTDAITERRAMALDLLYGDHQGGQRTISRFSLIPAGEGGWLATIGRHWNLDRPDPR
jgi:hypothetical protein